MSTMMLLLWRMGRERNARITISMQGTLPTPSQDRPMLTPPAIMASVALLCAAGAVTIVLLPIRGPAVTYFKRIAATMLGAGAMLLAMFAFAIHSWSVVP
jgi:hypothetical protein